MDIKEWLWVKKPTAAGLKELEAMALLGEYFSHLEEDVYDKTLARHEDRFGGGTYPKYLTIVSKNCHELLKVVKQLQLVH